MARRSRIEYADPFGPLTEYTYNANGSLETATLGNSARHTYVYDALNRLRFLEVDVGGSTLHGYEYGLKVTGTKKGTLLDS
jgi:hypothetical protein